MWEIGFCVERDLRVVSHSVREEKGKIDLDFLVNRIGKKRKRVGIGKWVGLDR